MPKTWQDFIDLCNRLRKDHPEGRRPLRRRWHHLRSLAERVLPYLSESDLNALLGKGREELDPEENDLKAVVSYGAAKGIVTASELKAALKADENESPPLLPGRTQRQSLRREHRP